MTHTNKSVRASWQLAVTTTMEDGVLVVSATGRIGHVSAPELQRVLEERIAAGARRIAIDLKEVDYIGSAGLVALDTVARRLHDLNGQLRLCALTEPALLVFQLAGWADRFVIEPTRVEAVKRLTG
jgi:anti-anti-sigma factor